MSSTTHANDSRSSQNPKKASIAAFLGSMLEYFDFFVYGSAAALVFPQLFFPQDDPVVSAIASLATFGAAYVARPVGAIILGHLGDRIGRKKVLIASLIIMGLSTMVIGLLPTYEVIGFWAPALLVACRLLQGFSVAAESTGASTLTLEHSPSNKRGFFTSFMASGTQAGITLGTLVMIPIAALPDEALYSWGWRLPFLASVLMLLVTLWVRSSVDEAPVFEKVKGKDEVRKMPVLDALRFHWRQMLIVTLVMTFAIGTTYYNVFGLAYATGDEVGMDRTLLLTIQTIVTGIAVFIIPVWGMVSDRIGRRPVLIFSAIGSVGSSLLFFVALMNDSLALVILASFLWISISNAAYVAAWPAFFAEMFPASLRFSGMAVGMQLGLILAGFMPTIGYALLSPGALGWLPVFLFTLVFWLAGGIAIAVSPDHHKKSTEQLGLAEEAEFEDELATSHK